MICPHCKSINSFRVRETRLMDGDIVRKRQCRECDKYCVTRERVEPGLSIVTERDKAFFARKKAKSKEKKANDNPLFGVWK